MKKIIILLLVSMMLLSGCNSNVNNDNKHENNQEEEKEKEAIQLPFELVINGEIINFKGQVTTESLKDYELIDMVTPDWAVGGEINFTMYYDIAGIVTKFIVTVPHYNNSDVEKETERAIEKGVISNIKIYPHEIQEGSVFFNEVDLTQLDANTLNDWYAVENIPTKDTEHFIYKANKVKIILNFIENSTDIDYIEFKYFYK